MPLMVRIAERPGSAESTVPTSSPSHSAPSVLNVRLIFSSSKPPSNFDFNLPSRPTRPPPIMKVAVEVDDVARGVVNALQARATVRGRQMDDEGAQII